MNLSNQSDYQLLLQATRDKKHSKELNIEWRKRNAMNFPYKLDIQGNIMNCIMDGLVGDKECDKLILDQANILRENRKSSKGINVKERVSIIEQLSLITGYNQSLFKKLDDKDLLKELRKYY